MYEKARFLPAGDKSLIIEFGDSIKPEINNKIRNMYLAIEKAGIQKEEIGMFIAGDLLNQIISSSFAARTVGTPYFGIYGACSSSMGSMALASLIMEGNDIPYVLVGTSSHNASAEKQFRYPTEYGAQKPPTAQWTVTGAGACILAKNVQGPKISSITVGKIVDMGVSDPFNMGSAMAPAAADTILAHFRDMGIGPKYYDIIATGISSSAISFLPLKPPKEPLT
jgi:stage V sporulation protein AD